MNFPEKFYVGTEQEKSFNLMSPPLGFATPYGTDAAFLKRKTTVDQWSSRRVRNSTTPYEGKIIDNVPQEGFFLETVVTRYNTSNKFFRIIDPHEFQVEISTENLLEILQHGTITNGAFVGKFVWGRDTGKNILCREDHPEYIKSLAPKAVTRTKMEIGDRIEIGKEELIYTGKFFAIFVGYTQRSERIASTQLASTQLGFRNLPYKNFYIAVYKSVSRSDDKSWSVFQDVTTRNNGRGGIFVAPNCPYVLKRSPSKFSIIAEDQHFIPPDIGVVHKNGWIDGMILFPTKNEMKEFLEDKDNLVKIAQAFIIGNSTQITSFESHVFE